MFQHLALPLAGPLPAPAHIWSPYVRAAVCRGVTIAGTRPGDRQILGEVPVDDLYAIAGVEPLMLAVTNTTMPASMKMLRCQLFFVFACWMLSARVLVHGHCQILIEFM